MREIPDCPVCGSAAEFYFRDYQAGACFGVLKCPYGHIRVPDSYWAGGMSKSKIRLIEKWSQQVEQKKGEVKNG